MIHFTHVARIGIDMSEKSKLSWWSVIITILAVIGVARLGSYFSIMNRDWYNALQKPSWQPPDWAFPLAWNTIFLLSIISIILIWNSFPRVRRTYASILLFVFNGILNVTWSALFFGSMLILPAVFDAALICMSVIAIMIVAWPITRVGSILLLPYALWTAFATVLTWVIHTLN